MDRTKILNRPKQHARKPRQARPRLIGRQLVWVALTLVLVVGTGVATNLVVEKRTLPAMFAERYQVTGGFVIDGSELMPAFEALNKVGEEAAPVVLASGALPVARTSIVADHWVYSVDVKEIAPNQVVPGNYSISLEVNGDAAGKVFVKKVAGAAAAQGVRVRFDAGAELEPSSLFYLVVAPVLQTGPIVEYVIQSETPAPGNEIWRGVGGAIDGVVNPQLNVPLGSTLKITAIYADGAGQAPHNLGITVNAVDMSNPVVDFTDDIENDGDVVVLIWTPSSAGTWVYVCKYHKTPQHGQVVVS